MLGAYFQLQVVLPNRCSLDPAVTVVETEAQGDKRACQGHTAAEWLGWAWNQARLAAGPKHKAFSVCLETTPRHRWARHPLPVLSPSAPKQAGLWCPEHNQALTNAGWKLPPHCAQGSEHPLMAQRRTCPVQSSLGLPWAWKHFSALARKDTEKVRSMRVCISQTQTAHNPISLGQPGPSLIFPARHVLRVLTTCSYSRRKRGQSQILFHFLSA